MTVVMRMLSSSAAGTRRTNSAIVMIKPRTNVRSAGVVGKTNWTGTGFSAAVPPVLLMRPPSTNPMNRMKSPMPTAIARFRESGTAFMIASRRPTSTSSRTTSPSITITPIAPAGVRPSVSTRKNATNALMPRPAASAIGTLAITPMAMHIKPATRAVAAAAGALKASIAAVSGMNMFDRMFGFRNRMYAMTMNVVTPAFTSVARFVPRSANLK
jgi:hypothetical protein